MQSQRWRCTSHCVHLGRIAEFLFNGYSGRGLNEFAKSRSGVGESPGRQFHLEPVQRFPSNFLLFAVHHKLRYKTAGGLPQWVSRSSLKTRECCDNCSAHFATAEAETPVESLQSPCSAASCTAKFPTVALSIDPGITSSPVRSAVNRLRNVFWLPPPTMNKRFNFFLVSVA